MTAVVVVAVMVWWQMTLIERLEWRDG